MAPLVKALCNDARFNSRVCVTAQHREMLDQVLDLFKFPPDYDLNLMTPYQRPSDITSKILKGIENVLDDYKPDASGAWRYFDNFFSSSSSILQTNTSWSCRSGVAHWQHLFPWPEEGIVN